VTDGRTDGIAISISEASCLGLTKFVISAFLLPDLENLNARSITLSVLSTNGIFGKVGRL